MKLRLQPRFLRFLVSAGLYLSSSQVNAQIVNRTIDDSFGDSQTGVLPAYSPAAGVWRDQTCPPCAGCFACAINPDVAQAFEGTYTAATYNPGSELLSITLQFQGIAIYVFFILVNNAGAGVASQTTASFILDGNPPRLFEHNPDLTTTDIQYNQLVFAQTKLENTQHTLVISSSGDSSVYVNFDYAIYTHDDGEASSTTVPIIGGSTSTSSSTITTATSGNGPVTSGSTGGNGGTTSGTTSRTSVPATGLSTTLLSSTSPTSTSTNVPAMANPKQSPTSTSADPSPQTASNTKAGVSPGLVAGSVVGGIAVLVLMILLVILIRRRNQHPEEDEDAKPFPFHHLPHMSESVPERNQPAPGISPFTKPPLPPAASTGSSQTKSSMSLPYVGTPAPPSDSSGINGGIIPGPATNTPTDIEAIRRARQTEIDERLRRARQAMTVFLASDNRNSANGTRLPLALRERPPNGGSDAEVAQEEERSMSDMREQVRSMREYITYLEEQQRSVWAQGLTNDPPPGYSPATGTARSASPSIMM